MTYWDCVDEVTSISDRCGNHVSGRLVTCYGLGDWRVPCPVCNGCHLYKTWNWDRCIRLFRCVVSGKPSNVV